MPRGQKEQNEEILILLTALIFVFPLVVIYHGLGAAARVVFCVLGSCLLEFGGQGLFFGKIKDKNAAPVVTGVVVAFLMPSNASYGLCLLALTVGILVMKLPFGGYGNNVFNPAAAGLAFVAVSFGDEFFSYGLPFSRGEETASTVLDALRNNIEPAIGKFNVFIGNQPGPMGGTQIMMFCISFVFLLYHRVILQRVVGSFLGVCALVAFFCPRIPGERLDSVFYELCSGMLVFAAVFMLTDPVTAPKLPSSQLVYGSLAGALTMLFRYAGELEEGVLFAILLSNAVARVLDKTFKEQHRARKKALRR